MTPDEAAALLHEIQAPRKRITEHWRPLQPFEREFCDLIAGRVYFTVKSILHQLQNTRHVHAYTAIISQLKHFGLIEPFNTKTYRVLKPGHILDLERVRTLGRPVV